MNALRSKSRSLCLFDIVENVHLDVRKDAYPPLSENTRTLQFAVEGQIQVIFGETPDNGDDV